MGTSKSKFLEVSTHPDLKNIIEKTAQSFEELCYNDDYMKNVVIHSIINDGSFRFVRRLGDNFTNRIILKDIDYTKYKKATLYHRTILKILANACDCPLVIVQCIGEFGNPYEIYEILVVEMPTQNTL